MVKPSRGIELACWVKVEYIGGSRIACDVLPVSSTCYFYKHTLSDESAEIDQLLKGNNL